MTMMTMCLICEEQDKIYKEIPFIKTLYNSWMIAKVVVDLAFPLN
jgi:hypothetical protein